ncbi:nitroreductase family protein [Ruficoccus amylovorans]|uniref:Nitroreductase family protein n=1 Tax=Ruficoccus amylovorans TaxID=1804625 RepID=A0A842HFB4_9BACT|nr:nitroreductase family protein [Ruficoccus amylovorans]MBC2595315.1 nitroreductase family protein [Ruficoccus amylovorans]
MTLKDRLITLIGYNRAWEIRSRLSVCGLVLACWSDFHRYRRHAYIGFGKRSRKNLRALIMKDAHRVEKGLSLAGMRPFFGERMIGHLQMLIGCYVERYGYDFYADCGLLSLRRYVGAHDAFRGQSGYEKISLVEAFCDTHRSPGFGTRVGVDTLSREEFFECADASFAQFVAGRRSVRDFSGKRIAQDTIRQAAALAQRFPSVCNRQSVELYYYNEPARVREILRLQNGNRGFGETLGGVAVITAIADEFEGVGERNQPYVDGGMFLMNFLLALHSLKVGACALNWSVGPGRDRQLKKLLGLDDGLVVISLVGVGEVSERLKIACSPRKPLGDVYRGDGTIA